MLELAGGACVSGLSGAGEDAYFPLSAVTSVTQAMADGSRFAIGLIGAEGMIGWSAVLGERAGMPAGLAQFGGGVLIAVPVAVLSEAIDRSPSLQALFLRFVQTFTVQMSHTIVANLRDGIEQRLSRWLLMLHDRAADDTLAITHGDLATALHVRRASITDALHVLEGNRMLRCTRGQVILRDRAALAQVAGDSYGPPENSYRQLIGAFGRP